MERGADIQRRYYTETAQAYDAMHVHEGDEHYKALRHLSGLIESHGIRSVLDVGSGTGRAIRYLAERHPQLELRGIEPVREMIERAEAAGVAPGTIEQGRGEALPFADGSFDAVCEVGMLHHVPDPSAVIREMMRVARVAVVLSDDNRFGWGPWPWRVAKLALYRLRLWDLANLVRTRGRRYRLSADDGLAYSYSVYDDYALLAGWADRVLLVPTGVTRGRGWLHPLLTTTHVMLCAIRET